jgi:hypothetical protein
MIAGSSITLPPVAGLLRLLDVGAGKPHARVRSSSHVQVNVPYRIGDGCACTCLGSTLASLCLCFLRSSCFPGNLVVRACKQVRLLVVGCVCLLAFQCFAARRCLIIIITACIIIIIIIIINS